LSIAHLGWRAERKDPSSVKTLETTAAYWEPRIKTYGFQTSTELSLLKVTTAPGKMASLGRALIQMGEKDIHFHLTFSRPCHEGLEFCFLIQRDLVRLAAEHIEQSAGQNGDTFVFQTNPAELVFFQGPHFGDRYGIADVALEALAAKGVEMMAIVCSGACIYIVLPSGKSEEAVLALAQTFEIPKVSLRRSSAASRTRP
jgi:aspartokinase